VSFDRAPGESFGIVGESGSGKSHRAARPLRPGAAHAGRWRLVGSGDLPAPGSKAFRRQVQMVFQDPYGSLHPRQTVDRILAEPLAIHGMADAEARIPARWTTWAWARAFASATRTSCRAGSASAWPWRAR
jgi:peptide/nickel transport system ATP-binding protein